MMGVLQFFLNQGKLSINMSIVKPLAFIGIKYLDAFIPPHPENGHHRNGISIL